MDPFPGSLLRAPKNVPTTKMEPHAAAFFLTKDCGLHRALCTQTHIPAPHREHVTMVKE